MASCELSQLANELKKLHKQDLINYIVLKKLPENVSVLSESVVKFLEGNAEQDVFYETHTDQAKSNKSGVCTETTCELIRADLKIANIRADSQTRLVLELEKSIDQLNIIIKLLQEKLEFQVNRSATKSKQNISNVNGATTSNSGSAEAVGRRTAATTTSTQKVSPPPPHGTDHQYESTRTRGMPTRYQKSIEATNSTKIINTVVDGVAQNGLQQRNYITAQQVAGAVLETKSQQIINDLTIPVETQNNSAWSVVQKNKKHRKTITGTGLNCKLKAAPSYVYFHVYRLDPSCTEQDLKSYLSTIFPEVMCYKLDSKYPSEYSSFKVGVFENHATNIMDSTIWSPGTKINKFFYRKREILREK